MKKQKQLKIIADTTNADVQIGLEDRELIQTIAQLFLAYPQFTYGVLFALRFYLDMREEGTEILGSQHIFHFYDSIIERKVGQNKRKKKPKQAQK